MFGNLFKSKTQLTKEIMEELENKRLAGEAEEQRMKDVALDEATRQLEAEHKAREEANQALKDSDQPWVDIKGTFAEETGQIQVELDWNDAFIEKLKKNGFTGTDDNQIIQRYVATMYKDVHDQLEEENMEKKSYE